MDPVTRAARLEELIRAYQDALDVVEVAPAVVFVRRNWMPVVRRLRRPRPTWYLRLLIRQHVARSVEKLSRHYSARSALDATDKSLAAERRLIKTFSDSLPPAAIRRARLMLAVAVLVLARWAMRLLTSGSPDGKKTFDKISSLMSTDMKNVGDAIDALFSATPEILLALTLALAAGGYGALRVVAPSFRVKRIILNQRLRPLDGFRRAVTAGSATRSTGVYELEAAIMRELGGRPLREFPIDLCASFLWVYVVIALGAAFWWEGAAWNPAEMYTGMSLVGVGLLRLALLVCAWWRRSRAWSTRVREAAEERPEARLMSATASV